MQRNIITKLKSNLRKNKKEILLFLKKFDKKYVRDINKQVNYASDKAWQEVECLACANCCKVMTPTFTDLDMKRISKHFSMSVDEFKLRWLKKDEDNGDWVNKKQPCQFLDMNTNMCTIYEIRPEDCAGFPHFNKKPFADYNHIYEQNIDYCPATYAMISNLKKQIEEKYYW